MDPADFPPNSHASRQGSDKKIEKITSGEVVRKKKSLGKKIRETFIAGDIQSSIQYVIFEIALPGLRDMIWEVGSGGIEKLMFGDSRRRGSRPPQAGRDGYVPYNRIIGGGFNNRSYESQTSFPQRTMSRQARAQHNFDEIVLGSRAEAEDVLENLYELVSRYNEASVHDLYDLVGITAAHTDNNWGWQDLRGARVHKTRDGYLLDLPSPSPLPK